MNESRTITRKLLRIGKWTGIAVAGLIGALTIAVIVLERRTYDAPMPAITASKDPQVIARGKYLAFGAAHCVDCHAPRENPAALAAGTAALTGGLEFKLPVGIARSANITPDVETGIGGLSDGQLARALRFGVGRHGRALLPFMPFAELSDADLTAVISFLRAQPPVKNPVVTWAPNLLGHVVSALVLKPEGPKAPVPAAPPPEGTIEYGRYLVHSVANCAGCHTQRDLRTGAFTGPALAGGLELEEGTPPVKFVSPNLTPDPRTGRITNWTDEIFVARFQTGKGPESSPMPWASFARMTESDLRAISRYLRTVAPVVNDTGPSVQGPSPKMASSH